MKKRIVFMVKNIFNQGGDTRAVSIIANELVKSSNYQVEILSLFRTEKKPIIFIDEKIKIHCLFDSAPFSLRKNYFKVVNRFNNFVKKNKIDVLLIEAMGFNCFVFPVLWKNKQIKTISVEHASYFDGGKKFGMAWFGREIACKYSDCVVVLTKQDLLDYQENMRKINRIEQIYNAINVKMKDTIYNTNSQKIISCGRLVEVKGFDLLLNIAKKVFEKYPDWQWHIYGEGPERKKLENSIVKLKLEENVILKGEVTDIYTRYPDYSFYVLTSRSESFGLVLIEALKAKLPVVSFECKNGPKEIIRNGVNGYLIPTFEIDTMADKICELIDNDAYRVSFSESSGVDLQKFNVKKVTEKWISIIESI